MGMVTFLMKWFDMLTTAFSDHIIEPLRNIGVVDVIDILLLAYLFYILYTQFKERRAGNMLVGLTILTALYFVSEWTGMYAVHTFFDVFYQVGAVVLLIVFQGDISDLLDKLREQQYKHGGIV